MELTKVRLIPPLTAPNATSSLLLFAGLSARPSRVHCDARQDPPWDLRRGLHGFPRDVRDGTGPRREHQDSGASRFRFDGSQRLPCPSLTPRRAAPQPTNLYPIRKAVEDENRREFEKLKEEAYKFEALDDSRGGYARSVMKERVRSRYYAPCSSAAPESTGSASSRMFLLPSTFA